MKTKITYSHSNGVTAELPAGDELARHAAEAYHHVLNTPERCNRPHGAREFAQAIRECYDMSEPRNAAIVDHLESLEPLTSFPTEEANLAAPNQQAKGFILRPLAEALLTGPKIAEVAVQCEAPNGETGTFLRGMRTNEAISPVFQSLAPLFQWIHEQAHIHEIEPARKYHVTV